MKALIALLVCVLAVFLLTMNPSVAAAQTTRIYQVVHPVDSIAGSQDPIPVTATVYYNDTTPGYQLAVGILDTSTSPQSIVPGIVTSSTDPCLNQAELGAICLVNIPASSGAEHIGFQIGGIFGGRLSVGTWDLNITSALFDTHENLVPGSVSSTLFEIILTPVALNVFVPASGVVSVDGVQQPPGPATVAVALGQHNVTVPPIIQVDSMTRLRFDHWSDGSIGTTRTILVTGNTSLGANYVTQYLLTLSGAGPTATGAGWYDANTTATFSANPYETMTGPFGAIGIRLKFQGWYENRKLLAELSGTILMDKPYTLTAAWQVDYFIPATIILGITAIAITYVVMQQTKTKSAARRRRRTRRRRP